MRKAAITPADREKYSNPIPNREFILDLLDESDEQLTRAQIAKALDIHGDEEKEALRRRLRAMERDGQLAFESDKTYRVLTEQDFFEGRVIGHREGFGFLACDTGGDDLFLHNSQMRKVFDGDRVRAIITGVDRRGREEASIVEITQRNTQSVVGRIRCSDGQYTLQAENTRIAHVLDLVAGELAGAEDGQYAVAEIIDYPTHSRNATAKITEVLGESMAPGMEIDVAIRSHNLPHLWPHGVVQAAEAMGSEVAEADKRNRVDLRNVPFVTIDGEDAQDFDDAVYGEPAKGGAWRLLVAIADVSHYVQPGSALDKEAQIRATSVYFPGQVIPMLPEALSNGLCSLNPKVDRLVMVCEMLITSAGKLSSYEFYEGVIHSQARLTYTDVNALLTAPESELGASVARRHEGVVPHVKNLNKLYDVLRQARTQRGSIDFDTHEVKFKFSAERKIEQIVPVERNVAHMLIEECMLCANVATARFLEKSKLPALYRVHAGPQAKKLEVLRTFLTGKGLKLAGGAKPTPGHYDRILSTVGARSDASVIQTMMLRSLSKAEYSPDNLGHFGLAYDAYAHFTSPIRRYPDLLVHRAIRSVIRKPGNEGMLKRALKKLGVASDSVRRVPNAPPLNPAEVYPYDLPAMLTLAEHCSMASRRADKASWDVEAWLKCEYMQDHIGECFEGIINSVTHFGLFVELKDTQVEGLVHIAALKQDYYQFDPVRQCLVGERTNIEYGMGDSIQVRLMSVDMDQRKIEFELWQTQEPKKKSRRRPKRKS